MPKNYNKGLKASWSDSTSTKRIEVNLAKMIKHQVVGMIKLREEIHKIMCQIYLPNPIGELKLYGIFNNF